MCIRDSSLSVQEVPKPKYGPKQALTKTIANGICGTDIHLMKKAFKGVTQEMYPLMLGHENAVSYTHLDVYKRQLRNIDQSSSGEMRRDRTC